LLRRFEPGGVFSTPWGPGSWGTLTTDTFQETVYADFGGHQHLINETRWPELLSIRCGDLEKVKLLVEE